MDWQQVARDNLILRVRTGSHLYGTATPTSDEDYVGVWLPPPEMCCGFADGHESVSLGIESKRADGRNAADAVDFTAYELRKFCQLALQNNPNILELLFVGAEHVLERRNPWAEELLMAASMFPHRGAHRRFVAYADAQRHKMRIKVENYQALQDALGFLREQDPHAVLGEFRDPPLFVGNAEKGKHLLVGDLHFEPGVYAKKACKMIEERLSKATHRAELFTKYGFDVKFGMHLIRLLHEGIELMRTGRLTFPLAQASELRDIRAGRYEMAQVVARADALVEEARRAYEATRLPRGPRMAQVEALVVQWVRAGWC